MYNIITMTIFSTYQILLSIPTIFCVVTLRYFALIYIYNSPDEIFSPTFWLTLFLAIALLFVTAIISFFLTRKSDMVLKKIKKESYLPTAEEKTACLLCYKNLNKLTITANIIGFFLGQIYMIIDGLVKGRITNDPIRIFLIIFQAVSFGTISGITTINGLDRVMHKFRTMLHINYISEKDKGRSLKVAVSISITVAFSLVFVGVNMMATLYGCILAGGLADFTRKGFVCLIQSLIISIPPFFIVINNLVSRIKSTRLSIDDIGSKGDLSKRIDITTLDNFGDMTTSINMLIDKLSAMIHELIDKTNSVSNSADVISNSVSTASDAVNYMSGTLDRITDNSKNQNELINQADNSISELVQAIENVRHHASLQSAAVHDISASVNQISANITSVTQTAHKARSVSEELSVTSNSGKLSIDNAIAAMSQIKGASDEVQDIIKVIQKIASQTNLLSMNAAIEAAHAGQYGAGFAVVADEVRSLAASSAQSAKNIQSHIKDMASKIAQGVEAINQAGTSFKAINEKIDENAQFVNSIVDAMEEQSQGARQTQDSTASVVEAVNAVTDLTSKETESANQVKEFMDKVISASQSTAQAISEGLNATMNLRESIQQVNNSVTDNVDAVAGIKSQVAQFKV